MERLTPAIINNAHKVAFLVKQYPKHDMTKIIKLFSLSGLDINVALWAAVELKLITVDPSTLAIDYVGGDIEWDFGPEQTHLQAAIVFAFTELAKTERDLEETYFGNWTYGYEPHDVMIALGDLLNRQILAKYELEDVYNKTEDKTTETYTFFTLWDNREQLWGAKQFKIHPVTGEANEQPEGQGDDNE